MTARNGSMLPTDRLQRVHWTVEAKDDDDLARRYDEWSASYDDDLQEVDGWAAPRFAADCLARFAAKDSRVLDAGAGTGWVGRALRTLGYCDIHGIDYSQGMLDKAAQTGAYASLARMNLNAPLAFAPDEFDAIICVGTLTYVTPICLSEFARVVRPGGLVAFSAQPRVHAEKGFQAVQEGLERDGTWERVFLSEEMQPLPKSFPEVRFRTTILRVLQNKA